MFVKRYEKEFSHQARTLPVEAVTVEEPHTVTGSEMERLHSSGWKIRGIVCEDYFYWVNSFHAKHPRHGEVFGDFESTIYATSEKGLNHFLKHHPFDEWDYYDI